jgi:hypothetical protein
MAIPQMQLTIDELRKLADTISKTDDSLAKVMGNLVKQTEIVDQSKTSFQTTLAKVAQRTLGDYKAQKKQLDVINAKNEEFRKREIERLQEINRLQDAGAEANKNEIQNQKRLLESLHKEHKLMLQEERKIYDDIAKKNLKIIKDFEIGIENIRDDLDKALTGGSVFKKISYIGGELQETLESAMEGGVRGLQTILKSSLSGVTQIFQMQALKLAEQGQKDIARIEELKSKGAVAGGGTDEDKELTNLETRRVSSESSAQGFLAMSKGLQVLSTSIMGVVSVFQMLIDAEAKVKEFNKDMLEDAGGSLSFLRSGQESLAESLNTYREGFASMSNTVGMKAEEIKSQFIALQDTNLFNKEKLKDFGGFERAFKTLSTYSKGFGLSITETTELTESFASSLAIDTSTQHGMETISDSFQNIGFYASKTNISTKAFANQLKEVNEKSTTFNKSITQTASVMFKLNKTLGASRAKDFFEGFEDLKEKEFGDLIKMSAMAGGPGGETIQKILKQNALTATSALQKTLGGKEEKEAFAKASAESGLNIDFTLPLEQIVDQLKGVDMSGDAFIKLSGSLEDSGLSNAPQILEKLKASITATQGLGKEKGYEEVAPALKELSIGGQYAMKFAEIKAIIEAGTDKGKTISNLGQKNLEIVKTALKGTGKTEKEINSLIALDMRARSDFMKAQDLQKKYAGASNEDRKKIDEELSKIGVMINDEGKLVTKNTKELVSNVEDMYVATGEIFSEEEKLKQPQVKSEQELMQDQVDATWGVGDRLSASFGVYLEQLNSYVARILSYISSWFGSQSNEEMKTQQRLQEEKIKEQENIRDQMKAEKRKIDELNKKGKNLTDQEKAQLQESTDKYKALEQQSLASEKSLEMLKKGIELKGSKIAQEQELATSSKALAELEYGKGSTGAGIGQLKESLGVSSNEQILKTLDQMRDIFEAQRSGKASEGEIKLLDEFKKKVSGAGLELQLDKTLLGTDYAKIKSKEGKDLFESIEGTISDTNKTKVNLGATKTQKNKLASFYKDLGITNQDELRSKIEEYRQILEQENDLIFNDLTEEQKKKKTQIEEAMAKHNITKSFESGLTQSDLEFRTDGMRIGYAGIGSGKIEQYGADAFTSENINAQAQANAKAQSEEDKKNEQAKIDANAKGVQQGLEQHDLAKSTMMMPTTPMNDFIWREKGGLQSFSPQDNVIGFKDNGIMGQAVNNMMAGNTTTNNNNNRALFNININGGNKDEVLKTITDALKRAGVVTERTSYA